MMIRRINPPILMYIVHLLGKSARRLPGDLRVIALSR
jgi:hypothetical protein